LRQVRIIWVHRPSLGDNTERGRFESRVLRRIFGLERFEAAGKVKLSLCVTN
jgi:hypothetical protein